MNIESDTGGVSIAIESIIVSRNKEMAVIKTNIRLGKNKIRAQKLVEYVIEQYPHLSNHWEKKE